MLEYAPLVQNATHWQKSKCRSNYNGLEFQSLATSATAAIRARNTDSKVWRLRLRQRFVVGTRIPKSGDFGYGTDSC